MAFGWKTESSDTEVRTIGAERLVGRELVARVSSTEHLLGAEALLRYVVALASDTGARVADGESARYGFGTVQFTAEDDYLLVHDARDGGAGELLVDDAVEVFEIQRLTSEEAGTEFVPPPADALAVVTPGFREGDAFEMVRYPSPEHMSGWWFLTNDYDGDVSRVEGHHLAHVAEWRPEVVPYLALAPGSVVTFESDGEAVSFDETLLSGRGPAGGPSGG